MRIGLVGYGHGGRFFHAPLIATLPGATFVGVVTRSPERRQQLSTDLPGVKAFDSIGQIVEAGVDALVISTTLKGRPALVLEAIEHGVAWSAINLSPPTPSRPGVLITAAERQGRVAQRLPEPALGFGFPDLAQTDRRRRPRRCHPV